MFLPKLNPIEPPWYGPVCPVVWEGRRREASPYPDPWSVADNIALPLRLAGTDEREIAGNLAELLTWLGLEKRTDAPASTLSGSERQLVATARAIIGRPDLLIADEPTGNVDAETAPLLARIFRSINRLGTTVVIATRDIAVARHPGDRVLHLENGRLSEAGLFDAPFRDALFEHTSSGNVPLGNS